MQTYIINPLAIIAIFAGIIEASALASLPFLSENSQNTYTWFLVGFPFFLTLLFFLTLNFNRQSLYQLPQTDIPGKTAPSIPAPCRKAPEDTLPGIQPPEAPEPTQTMFITLSGPDTQKIIENHIRRALTHPHGHTRSWILDNLDTHVRVHLSVNALGDETHHP